MNVTHVVLSLDVGGLERVVLDLIRAGRSLGQNVSVLCLERPGILAAQAETLGARVVCVNKRPGLRLKTVGIVREALEAMRADVVHTHQITALFYVGPAARRAGVTTVVHTEHGKHYDGRLRTRWLGRFAAMSARRFFCVSADIAAAVVARRVAPAAKVMVVPNGIDVGRFDGDGSKCAVRAGFGIPPHAPVVGTVGRLSEVKRQDVLLKAFARLQLPEVAPHLIIVGDGPLKDDLQQLAVALGVEDRVHFAGYQAHPERYLGAMNVFALTSRSEGMPLAILEAGAAGIPVVASRVGGVPELIQDGMTGLMFESGNDVALAARLTELLADPALMRRMGKAALDCVRSGFDLSVMAENYQRHYVDLLSEHRERRPVSKDTTRSYSVA